MLLHYLKVAVRNLLKYKMQSAISIVGLAIGFACFALASLWIRYEMTYDSFHHGAERIYLVRTENKESVNGLNSVTPYPLAGYLKETFAEVEGACNMQYYQSSYKVDEVEKQLNEMRTDSAVFSVFDIRLLEGSMEFLMPKTDKIAITRRCAQQLFGQQNPIGKEIFSVYQPNHPLTICAIVSEWPEHSNLCYDIISRSSTFNNWNVANWQTYIRLTPQSQGESFTEKLYNHVIKQSEYTFEHLNMTPLTSMRYHRPDPSMEADVKLKHVTLFAVAGSLVILCSLLNYLTMFISQIRIRSKEFALRTVNGASPIGLFVMLITEYLILLLLSVLLGMWLVEIVMPWFVELASIKLTRSAIYAESAAYCLATTVLATLLSAFPILYYRKKSLQSVISNQQNGRNKNLFRKVSVAFQLFISIGFIFCAAIMMKQLLHLTHTDAGMNRKNIAAVLMNSDKNIDAISDYLKNMPEVTEVAPRHNPLLNSRGSLFVSTKEWEDMPANAEEVRMSVLQEDTSFARFYGLTLLEGEMITPSSASTDLVLNEAAVKAFGWHQAVGKTFKREDGTIYRIVGVIKDFYTQAPTLPVSPIAFAYKYELPGGFSFHFNGKNNILFKYKEGTWPICKRKLEEMLQKEYPEARMNIVNAEEKYDEYLTSENALLKMLGILAGVCTLLSIFAIYSLVSLTCEQRRKEIAIRKVNGADIKHILSMFAKEYAGLLMIAAVLSFSIGYYIMKQWVENYTLQTNIDWWVFASILMGIAMIITLCIGQRIWKAANENPADVMKSE